MQNSHLKSPVHGWIILDKPNGLTSTQALGRVRRLVHGKKAGHGGTLDPLATGILPLAFGEATKLIPYIMDGDKDYEFTVCWGDQRDTDDAEGKSIATSKVRPTEDSIRRILPDFIGTIHQTPPAFSAIKVQGERSYDIARAGGAPELKPRPVLIHNLTLVKTQDADHTRFHVHCGKGMYVRSLARDMAEKLGTVGHISALRRTRVGPFKLAQAVTLGKLEQLEKDSAAATALQPLGLGLGTTPVLSLLPEEAHRLRAGQAILIRPQHQALMEIPCLMTEHLGVPIALVEPKAGEFRVLRGFQF